MITDVDYLKEFVYDSKLRELGIFSKQYFNSILYSMYKEIPESDLLCFTFGDFNKLNKINKDYSYEAGDEALKTSLKLIIDTLPSDTIISRIAGDEFCFLNLNKTKKDMEQQFKHADYALKEHSDINYGLTITTSSIDSTMFSYFDDMYVHTELDVNRKKKSNHGKDPSLSEALHSGLSNYFSYYRIESNRLPKEYYSVLKSSIIDFVIHNLECPNKNLTPYLQKLKQRSIDIDFEDKHLEIKSNLASEIHNYILHPEGSSPTRNIEFNRLFNFLITDPLTGQVTKRVFDKTFLPLFAKNEHSNLSIRLFDLAFLKLSNDLIGHNPTDEKITELYKSLVSQIQFEGTSSKVLASAGNCGLLLIEHANSTIPDSRIDEILKQSLENQSILDMTTASRKCTPDKVAETIAQLAQDCKEKKEQSKLDKIKHKETILPLQLALKDSIRIYMKTCDNPYSLENKQKLVTQIFETLTTVITEQFQNQDSNIFSEER